MQFSLNGDWKFLCQSINVVAIVRIFMGDILHI